MRRGFLRSRSDREADTKAKIDKAMAEFVRWLGRQAGTTETPIGPFQEEQFRKDFEVRFGKAPSDDLVERTRRFYEDRVRERESVAAAQKQGAIAEETVTGTTESAPNVPTTSESQGAEGGSGPPQPEHFGITPEQVAAYRPPFPKTPCSWSSWLLEGLLAIWTFGLFAWAFVAVLAKIFGWEAAILVVVVLLVWWGVYHLSRNDATSCERRSRIAAYLHAKARYEKALREEELDRRRQQEEYWLNLSGLDFEKEMSRLYRADGYSVEATPATGDEGADLLLRKDGELIVVQCKRQDKPVGPHIVRDLYGTIHHFHASRAFLDATGGFTEAVRQYVRGKPIELHDLDYILSLQDRLSRKSEPSGQGQE